MSPTPQDAKRELARRKLEWWCRMGPPTMQGPMAPTRWQLDLCPRLDLLRMEALRRQGTPQSVHSVRIVLISVPPQEGKTEIVTRRWVSHLLAAGLSCAIISYSASLASQISDETRAIIRSPEALAIYPHLGGETSKDASADWTVPSPRQMSHGAPDVQLLARGKTGGGLTGRSPDVIVLDDMYQDAVAYGSAAERRNTDTYVRTAAMARLWARGGMLVCVGTRWGTEDTHAMLSEIADAMTAAAGPDGATVEVERWDYPLVASPSRPDLMGRQPGEYVSHRWDQAKERMARASYGRHASAILDCDPRDMDGPIWQRRHFAHRYTEDCESMAARCDLTILSVDGAATEGGGDYTSIRRWGWIGPDSYLLGAWRGQWGFSTLMSTLTDLSHDLSPDAIVIEDASSGRQAIQQLRNKLRGVIPYQPRVAKAARWDAVLPAYEAGQVHMPMAHHAPWIAQSIDRLVVLTGQGDEIDDEADADAQAHLWWMERKRKASPNRLKQANALIDILSGRRH